MIVSGRHKVSTRGQTFRSGSVNLILLRIIELIAFFWIMFIARYIGEFTYRTRDLSMILLLAAILYYGGGWVWDLISKARHWHQSHRERTLLWYTSYVDLLAVMGLIYVTGTIESPFVFLLTVPLFFAGNMFSWKTTVRWFLVPAMFIISALALLELKGIVPHQSCYEFNAGMYLNHNYLAGSLLVICAFVSLVLFLSNAFQDRLNITMERLREKGDESDSRLSELMRLHDISIGINSAMSIDTLLKIMAKEATLLIEQPWAGILLFNDRQEITHSVFVGINQDSAVKLGKKFRRGGLSEWIWSHNAPIVIENIARDQRADGSELFSTFKVQSVVGYPLAYGNNVTGAIFAGGFEPQAITDHKIGLLQTLAAQLAASLEKSRLHDSMERKLRDRERQMEAMEKTNILKSDFVNHVSHELRTPLTSIKAYLETLEENIDDPNFTRAAEFLEITSKETNRLIRIVDDILDVSKIEFGERPLERSSFHLRDVVDDVLSMLSPTLNEKDLTAVVDIPDSLPRIDGDADLIKQVVINLVSNAIKYSSPSSSVTVSAVEEALDVVVSVQDNGIGIPANEVGSVFDKYFRVRARKDKAEGVGLGLAIVKNIVEQHGGVVGVKSTEGEGSTFTFTIPREHHTNDLVGYIAQVVDARDQLHDMLEVIVRMIAELLDARIVSLMLLDASREELFIKLSYGLDEWIVENTRVRVGEGIAGKVAQTGEGILIQNIEQNEMHTSPNNPQYETASLLSVPLVIGETVVGVINVNNKTDGKMFTQDDLSLIMSFSARISRALERVRVVEDADSYLEDTVAGFRRILEMQTKTKVIEQSVHLAVKVSRKLGLEEKDVRVIQYVASVHDIGMTEISDEILDKALNLTSEERNQIEQHPQRGAELVRPLEFVEHVSNIILYHHERVDGTGYPMGLRGDRIPIGARILAVIDAYQSMTEGRPYKPSRSVAETARELADCAGRQFDADVVDAFVSVLKEDGLLTAEQEQEFKRRIQSLADAPTRGS